MLEGFGVYYALIRHGDADLRGRGIYWKTRAIIAHDRVLLGTETRGLELK